MKRTAPLLIVVLWLCGCSRQPAEAQILGHVEHTLIDPKGELSLHLEQENNRFEIVTITELTSAGEIHYPVRLDRRTGRSWILNEGAGAFSWSDVKELGIHPIEEKDAHSE
jgi:hypothetical protein